MTMELLRKYWQENIKVNIKKISATLGSVLVTFISILLFSVKSGLDVISTLFMVFAALGTSLTTLINIIFKGDVEEAKSELNQLKKIIDYEREIAEYRITIAAKDGKIPDAIIANKEWNLTNNMLEEKKE